MGSRRLYSSRILATGAVARMSAIAANTEHAGTGPYYPPIAVGGQWGGRRKCRKDVRLATPIQAGRPSAPKRERLIPLPRSEDQESGLKEKPKHYFVMLIVIG
jgi:hypothetical protein